MKIAILGTRGIPARYGGFETFADQLATRLARRGHEVTVYCRKAFTRSDDAVAVGVRRVILSSISTKYLDTVFHTFISALHVSFTDADVVLMCNVANSPVAWIPRLFGKPVVLNVDGLDRKRRKWNLAGRTFLHICEVVSKFTPNSVVTDAVAIQKYYRERYGKETEMIAYGAEVEPPSAADPDFGLLNGRYILYVSRLEPENNPELVLSAYAKIETDWPLVVVGNSVYDPAYEKHLREIADPRVIFLGAVYGSGYWVLQRNAGVFVFACEVGGTHPALVEAMAAGIAIVYLHNTENAETAGECAAPFEATADDLAAQLKLLIKSEPLRAEYGHRAAERARARYSWDSITDQYEALMQELIAPEAARTDVSINSQEEAEPQRLKPLP